MQGAREFARLFRTGQYGRLYFVSQSHARGETFRIFVLPAGENPIPNGPNAPLNKNAIEVYGIVSGQPGWTEKYGWLHRGPWQDDFHKIVENRKIEIFADLEEKEKIRAELEEETAQRVSALLAAY
jgi:hypothetical protein